MSHNLTTDSPFLTPDDVPSPQTVTIKDFEFDFRPPSRENDDQEAREFNALFFEGLEKPLHFQDHHEAVSFLVFRSISPEEWAGHSIVLYTREGCDGTPKLALRGLDPSPGRTRIVDQESICGPHELERKTVAPKIVDCRTREEPTYRKRERKKRRLKIGDVVKLGFEPKDDNNSDATLEFMFVEVFDVGTDWNSKIRGWLLNIPFVAAHDAEWLVNPIEFRRKHIHSWAKSLDE